MGGQKFWRDWVVITLGLALSWVVLFTINPTLHLDQSDYPWISVVFLPAGLRIYGVMLFRELAIPGLFLGNLIVTIIKSHSLPTHLQLDPSAAGIISSLTPYASLLLFERLCNIKCRRPRA